MEEYNNCCDNCKDTGDDMFARIFFRKIDGKWVYLCNKCWNEKI